MVLFLAFGCLKIHTTCIALVNVYAPSCDNDAFLKRLFSTFPDMSSHYLIMGGDFNCWLDPQLARSSTDLRVPSRSSKVIQSSMKESGVSDLWRFLNPSKREYSFFSHAHHTFTRIDFFLIDNRLLSLVQSCKSDASVISEQAPISMNIYFKGITDNYLPWRFNTCLLLSEDCVKFVSRRTDFFLSVNKTPDVSVSNPVGDLGGVYQRRDHFNTQDMRGNSKGEIC